MHQGKLVLSIMSKDIATCRLEQPGIEPTTCVAEPGSGRSAIYRKTGERHAVEKSQ